MSHGSEHSLPSSDYEVDAAFEAAMAESAVHPSLPATSTVRASEQLAGLESEMTSLKGEFQKCGVDDVFAFAQDKSTAGDRARRLVTSVLQLQLHPLADEYCTKKTMRERASLQRSKYDAAKWADGCYRSHPPDCFCPDQPDRAAVWKAATSELRSMHLEAMLELRGDKALSHAMTVARSTWVEMWTRRLVRAKEILEERDALLVTPEKITAYFSPGSYKNKSIKRKIF